MQELLTKDFKKIVVNDTPLIDVRAEVEFEKGAFKTSVNMPIMNDEERCQVGIKYKNEGNEEAIKLGHELVTGEVREERVKRWVSYIEENPETMIYCFRGGQRSAIAQEWINNRVKTPVMRLEGGYKAFRNYLIDELEPEAFVSKPILLGGCTGSGKTILLKELEHAVDLEGIANHRGSTFGRQVTPQPSQINFENNLAYAFVQHREKEYKSMVLEDEGTHVGSCYLPRPLSGFLKLADLVLVDVSLEDRVQITLEEYVVNSQKDYIATASGIEEGMKKWLGYIEGSIERVQKRLGGDRTKQMLEMVRNAYDLQEKTGSVQGHEAWISTFLKDYYDPMYLYQIENTTKKITFRGNEQEVVEYLKSTM